jgi:DNA adenine methylase
MTATILDIKLTPFLKYTGGKTRLLPELLPRVPGGFTRLISPFFGGGALELAIAPKKAILADANPELINALQVIRDFPYTLIEYLSHHAYSPEYYLDLRGKRTTDPVKRASRYIYLSKCGFNGVQRTNKKGENNVPFGKHKSRPDWVQRDKILAISRYLNKNEIEIANSDFEAIIDCSTEGDFLYLDPPYHGTHTAYVAAGFTEKDQIRLKETVNRANNRGSKFLLSSSDTDFIRSLWQDYKIEEVTVRRSVSRDASTRGEVTELLISNYRI